MKGHLQPKPLRQSFGWWLWWRAVVNEQLNPQAAYLVGVVCLVDTDAKKQSIPVMINLIKFHQISSKPFLKHTNSAASNLLNPSFLRDESWCGAYMRCNHSRAAQQGERVLHRLGWVRSNSSECVCRGFYHTFPVTSFFFLGEILT